MRLTLGMVVIGVWLCTTVLAGQRPPQGLEMLFRQLDDEDFDRREEATSRLQELEAASVPFLEEARMATRSPEVIGRLDAVLAGRASLYAIARETFIGVAIMPFRGFRVELDGSPSTSANTVPRLAYVWRQTSGPEVRLESAPTEPRAYARILLPGTYRFELMVFYGGRRSAPAGVNLAVGTTAMPETCLDVFPLRDTISPNLGPSPEALSDDVMPIAPSFTADSLRTIAEDAVRDLASRPLEPAESHIGAPREEK